MSQLAIAERANGSCASKGYSWFRCTSPIYFVGCCKNGTSPCDNGCKDNELDPQEVASSSSNTQASTRTATTLPTTTSQPSMMSARATATQTTTEAPVGGTVVPDTPSSSSSSSSTTTTRISSSSTDKGGAIFQVPTATNSTPSPTPLATKPTSTSTAALVAAQEKTTGKDNGPIIGGVVGGLLIFVLAALLLFLCWKRRKTKKELALNTIPYSVAAPFSVNRKSRPETVSSSTSVTPALIHDKRVTADTTVERNDSTRVGGEGEDQGPVELPTHHSRTFLPETVMTFPHTRPLSELPGPINLPPPPSTHAELPSHDLRTPQAEIPRNVNVSPIDPLASVRTSMVSPLTTLASSPNPNNSTPHVMAWANFDGTQSTKVPKEAYPGKRAYSPRIEVMQERVTGPNMEPVWPSHPREMPKVREGPEDVGS